MTSGEFQQELQKLLNRCCIENESDTPDFILAQYLVNCLNTFQAAARDRDRWYGFQPWPKPLLAAPNPDPDPGCPK
jgi:hypothetical protein